MNIPDNYSQWEYRDRLLEMDRERLPKCDRCHDEIQEHYFDIYGEIYCEECAHKLFRKNTEDYIN